MLVICFFLVHEVFGGLSLKVVFLGETNVASASKENL